MAKVPKQPKHRLAHWLWPLACLLAPPTAGAQCQLQAVAIMPVAAEHDPLYLGRSGEIELRFINEKKQGAVEVFPEPPLTVVQQGMQCDINGGIWRRDAVWLGAQGKTLVTVEYSGSNQQFMFYHAASCRVIGTLDVSNAKWEIGAGVIKLIPTVGKPRTVRLDASCNVMGTKNKRGNHGK